MAPSTDKIIANRYKVVKELSGGMGVVYLCLDLQQNDFPLALKTFKPEFLTNKSARERFLHEASIWVSLEWHPNIVQAYGTEYVTSSHEIYLILELIPTAPGRKDPTLRSIISSGIGLNYRKLLQIALEVTRGMKYASSKIPGLIHRDLKPENILIDLDGTSRITDFGIAATRESIPEFQFLEELNNKFTTDGPIGTPYYMNPEQWKGQALTQASDIYAFGCVVFEMLTGQFIIDSENPLVIRDMHIDGRALKRLVETKLPDAVLPFLSTCLQPDPARRFQKWEAVELAIINLFSQLLQIKVEPEVLPIDVSLHSQISRGASLVGIGEAYMDIGENAAAIRCFEQASLIGIQQNHPVITGSAEGNIGIARFNLGQYEKAINHYEKAISEFSIAKNPKYIALNHGNIGNAYFQLGDFQKAKEQIDQVIKYSKEIGDKKMFAFWLGNLANIISNLGNDRKAAEYYAFSLDVARKNNDKFNECKMLANLGIVFDRLSDPQKSQLHFDQALEIANQLGDQQSVIKIYLGLGKLYARQSNIHKAIRFMTDVVDLATKNNDMGTVAQACCDLGTAYSIIDEHDEAIKQLSRALQLAEQLHIRQLEARAHWSLGNTFGLKMDFTDAIKHLRSAVVLLKELQLPEYSIAKEQLNEMRKVLGLL